MLQKGTITVTLGCGVAAIGLTAAAAGWLFTPELLAADRGKLFTDGSNVVCVCNYTPENCEPCGTLT